jgi:hypothetical protein
MTNIDQIRSQLKIWVDGELREDLVAEVTLSPAIEFFILATWEENGEPVSGVYIDRCLEQVRCFADKIVKEPTTVHVGDPYSIIRDKLVGKEIRVEYSGELENLVFYWFFGQYRKPKCFYYKGLIPAFGDGHHQIVGKDGLVRTGTKLVPLYVAPHKRTSRVQDSDTDQSNDQ